MLCLGNQKFLNIFTVYSGVKTLIAEYKQKSDFIKTLVDEDSIEFIQEALEKIRELIEDHKEYLTNVLSRYKIL